MKINFKPLNANKIAKKFGENRALGIFVAETCARYMNPYVPMQSGMLSQNYTTKPWQVEYTQPYARKQFYAGWEHSKEQHPLAVSHWDVPVQNAKIGQIAKEIESYMKRM